MSIPEIEADEAARLVADGACLLDVREADEWESGHAPEALWIPMGHLSTRWTELPADSRIAVVCRSGGRSAMVTEALLGQGIDAVNVVGGMLAWASEGLPVVLDDGSPGTI
jgi:rhodanese-related sulfurtransferase